MALDLHRHNERAVLDETVARFSRDFGPSVDETTVRTIVERSYGRFEDARVREFVVLLVERTAKHELRRRVEAGDAQTEFTADR